MHADRHAFRSPRAGEQSNILARAEQIHDGRRFTNLAPTGRYSNLDVGISNGQSRLHHLSPVGTAATQLALAWLP
jgi:hypothetical protein